MEPKIEDKLTLDQVFDGIKNNLWEWEAQHTLIVIDQFEQWLASETIPANSALAQALRHCDGRRLSCLVIVRDDFSQQTSRLLHGLDFNWNENLNVQRVDQFDKEHAFRVLFQLGRAMGKLPEHEEELDESQRAFIDRVFSDLAEDERVAPVHLTMFAEMFKTRQWNQDELGKVGGIAGVGHRYLESIFGKNCNTIETKEFRGHATTLLEYLLPIDSSGIRGAAKSETELRKATDLERNPGLFNQMMDYIVKRLKLVVTEELIGESDDPSRSGVTERHYRLTHDYLVSAIREWLGIELRKTMAGRARIQLRDIAALNRPDEQPKVTPNNSQWLLWRFLLPKRSLSEHEVKIMAISQQRFLRQTFNMLALLTIGCVALFWTWRVYQGNQAADRLQSELFGQQVQRVPAIIEKLKTYDGIVRPRLTEFAADRTNPAEQINRANLYLVSTDATRLNRVTNYLVEPKTSVNDLAASIAVIRGMATDQTTAQVAGLVDSTIANKDEDDASRLRALALRIGVGGYYEMNDDLAQMVGFALAAEPVTTLPQWLDLLRPNSSELNAMFTKLLFGEDRSVLTRPMAIAVNQYLLDEKKPELFAELLARPNDAQFQAIFSLAEEELDEQQLTAQLSTAFEMETHPARLADLAVALLRFDQKDQFLQCLANEHGLETRSHAIVSANNLRVSFDVIQNLYETCSLENDLLRQGLLLVMAQQAPGLLIQNHQRWLARTAEEVLHEDMNSGCFAAAELILRRRGRTFEQLVSLRESRRFKYGERRGNVLIDFRFMPFTVIEPDMENGLLHPIAVALYETSNADTSNDVAEAQLDKPFLGELLTESLDFCNLLNSLEGRQRFPITLESLNPDRIGYRIMTPRDWDIINEKIGGVDFLGYASSLGQEFTINFSNSDSSRQREIGSRLPDQLGLFDLYGNARELQVLEMKGDKLQLRICGGSSRVAAATFFPEDRTDLVAHRNIADVGLRLIKTLAD